LRTRRERMRRERTCSCRTTPLAPPVADHCLLPGLCRTACDFVAVIHLYSCLMVLGIGGRPNWSETGFTTPFVGTQWTLGSENTAPRSDSRAEFGIFSSLRTIDVRKNEVITGIARISTLNQTVITSAPRPN